MSLFFFLRLVLLFCIVFLADVFQSEMWSELFSSIPEHLQPTASPDLVKGTVPGSKADDTVRTYLEVLDDGNVGLLPILSAPLLPVPFKSRLICSACFKMLILLLQFLTPSITSTGRSRWLACLKSPFILWFPEWLARLRGFGKAQSSKGSCDS